MVGALGFCSRSLGLRPGHFVVSLGKTGYVHSASLQPGVKNNPQKKYLSMYSKTATIISSSFFGAGLEINDKMFISFTCCMQKVHLQYRES
mgnify:CR=1 FL=1